MTKIADVVANPSAYGEAEGITMEEALAKYGPEAARETEISAIEGKTPEEITAEILKEGEEDITPEKEEIVKEEVIEPEEIVKEEPITPQVEEVVKEKPITPEPTEVTEEIPAKEITAEPKYYTVQKGETLWGLSEKNLGAGKSWHEIQDVEGKTFTEETAKTLQVGQQILIPNK